MQDKAVIVGCGGHARSVADVLLCNEPDTNVVFVDSEAKHGERIFGFSVVRIMPDSYDAIYCGIGDNSLRKQIFPKYQFNTLISKDAYLGRDCEFGKGSFIAHHAHIGPCVFVGVGCIINTSAVLEHEVKVGNFSHVSVNTTCCGRVCIGSDVCVGAGAVIKDKIHICNNVVIGCGASVVKDIGQSGIYVGCPAKRIKDIK